MENREKRIAKRRKQNDELVFTTDGPRHHVSAKGDTAKGLAAATSAIFGFVIGIFLASR